MTSAAPDTIDAVKTLQYIYICARNLLSTWLITSSNFRRDQQPNMSDLPKQQDRVEHFCAMKSWTATNSETMQSRSLTAKPLILDSTTLRTLRPQTPEPSSARNGKASNLSKSSKIIESRTANQNPSTKMPCAQKTAHLEKMVGKSRGRVGGESGESRGESGKSRGRVGESRGRVGGRLPHTHV